jgi:hypothetical protein
MQRCCCIFAPHKFHPLTQALFFSGFNREGLWRQRKSVKALKYFCTLIISKPLVFIIVGYSYIIPNKLLIFNLIILDKISSKNLLKLCAI